MSRRDPRIWRRITSGIAPAVPLPSTVSGLVLWLEADVGVTGTSPVTAWADQSGTGNNVAPFNTGPTLSSSGPNGHKAISFDGTDNTTIENRAASLGNAATGQTLFCVLKTSSTGAGQIVAMTANAASPLGGYAFEIDVNANAERGILVVNNAYVQDSVGSATTNWEAWTIVGNGSSQILRVNGAQRTTGALTPANQSGVKIGGYTGSLFYSGLVWALLVYNRGLSAGEVATVEAYIRSKTAIW